MKVHKYVLNVAGIMGTILGITAFIPSMLKENYIAVALSAIVMMAGIMLIAIAFGDADVKYY